jgi:hypothetical protein
VREWPAIARRARIVVIAGRWRRFHVRAVVRVRRGRGVAAIRAAMMVSSAEAVTAPHMRVGAHATVMAKQIASNTAILV